MTIQQLKAVHDAQPFAPFVLHTTDGRFFPVPHRDFLSHSPGGRTLVVYRDDESFSILDLLLVTEIEVPRLMQ